MPKTPPKVVARPRRPTPPAVDVQGNDATPSQVPTVPPPAGYEPARMKSEPNWEDYPEPTDDDEPPANVRSIASAAKAKVAAGEANEPLPRVERQRVLWLPTEAYLTVDRCLSVLATTGAVYQRGAKLVTVSDDRAIVPLDLDQLAGVLDRAVELVQDKKDKQGNDVQVRIPMPDRLAKLVRAGHAGRWPAIAHLDNVTARPLALEDGQVVSASGYHAPTRTIVQLDGTWPTHPTTVTLDDARQAADRILWLFREFPFVDEHDRGAALALVLTIAAREMVRGPAPIFGISADQPGAGKTLLGRVASIIGTGRKPREVPMPRDPEELRKTLFAEFLTGREVITLDNVRAGGSIGDEWLASATTSAWDGTANRVLQHSVSTEVPWRGTLLATGNNLRAANECGRRTVLIRLDVGAPGAAGREFSSDVEADALASWRSLRCDAVDVLRGYMQAGAPAPIGTLGSFHAWWRTIVGAVAWLDRPTLAVPRTADAATGGDLDADDDTQRLATALRTWRAVFDEPLTAADALSRIRAFELQLAYQELNAALQDLARTSRPLCGRDVGYALRSCRGRWARLDDGWAGFCGAGVNSAGVTLWTVTIRPAG